jgi:hypothetical protein
MEVENMERQVLDGVKNGDSASIKQAMQSISENTPRNELRMLWECAMEGMVAQNTREAEGVDAKLELLNLSTLISHTYVKDPGLELIDRLSEAAGKSKGKIDSSISNTVMEKAASHNKELELATAYDDITALALVTSQNALKHVDQRKALVFGQCGEQAFKHAISVGAAIATGVVDGRAAEIAKACLVNAALNGGEETRRYSVEALAQFTNDMQLKQILVAIEKADRGAVKEAASYALRTIRENDEIETARADRDSVLFEYPEGQSPQSVYIDMIFTAVETVLTKTGKKDEVKIAVKQLTCFGANPEPMAELIDEPNMGLIQRNVENALVHALVHGDQGIADEAKIGIRKIGSDRVMTILDRVVERERGEDGTLTAKGSEVRELVAEMQRAKFGHTKPPLPPRKRTARQPRLQVQ